MADNNSSIDRRLARLEALFAVFLVSDFPFSDSKEFRYLIDSLLYADYSDKKFSNLIIDLLEERKRLPQSEKFRNRLNKIEERLQNYEALSNEIRQRLDGILNQDDERHKRFNNQIEFIRSRDEEIGNRIKEISHLQVNLQSELHTYLITQSFDLDLDEFPIYRYLPIKVYLSESNHQTIDEVSKAVELLTKKYGFTITDDFPAESGSWWKRWFARTQEVASKKEVAERLEKIERAIELKGLHEPQSIVDKNEAEAAAALIKSLENVPKAAVQTGSLLLIKVEGNDGKSTIQIRTLTPKEMIYLEKNQYLLSSPQNILPNLAEHCQEESLPSNE